MIQQSRRDRRHHELLSCAIVQGMCGGYEAVQYKRCRHEDAAAAERSNSYRYRYGCTTQKASEYDMPRQEQDEQRDDAAVHDFVDDAMADFELEAGGWSRSPAGFQAV